MNAVLNDAHVTAWLAWLEEQSQWHDATLDACTYWGAREDIKTSEAAMLLCGLHPRETTEEAATKSSQSENFQRLLEVFVDVAEHHPASRTLQSWLGVAKDKGLSYAPWIDGYAKVKAMQAPPPEQPTSPMVAVVVAAGDAGPDAGQLAASQLQATIPSSASAVGETTEQSTPAHNTAMPAPVVAVDASGGKSLEGMAGETLLIQPKWTLREPKRYQGYARPLFLALKAAHGAGKSCPRPRDVLDSFSEKMPLEVIGVQSDGFTHYDARGNSKAVGLEAIAEAIRRMTS